MLDLTPEDTLSFVWKENEPKKGCFALLLSQSGKFIT